MANTLEAVMDRLTRIRERWDEGSSFCFAASTKLGAHHLGLVTISTTEPDVWAIAYMMAPSEWGHGYATECARCVMDFAFEGLEARSVWAGAATWNKRSLRIAEKLGMRHFRSSPRSYQIEGRWIPTEDHKITADEWIHNNQMHRTSNLNR